MKPTMRRFAPIRGGFSWEHSCGRHLCAARDQKQYSVLPSLLHVGTILYEPAYDNQYPHKVRMIDLRNHNEALILSADKMTPLITGDSGVWHLAYYVWRAVISYALYELQSLMRDSFRSPRWRCVETQRIGCRNSANDGRHDSCAWSQFPSGVIIKRCFAWLRTAFRLYTGVPFRTSLTASSGQGNLFSLCPFVDGGRIITLCDLYLIISSYKQRCPLGKVG